MASYRAVACEEGEILGCTMSSVHAHAPGPKLKMRLFDLVPKSTSISAITLSPTPEQWAAGAVIGSIGTRVRVYSNTPVVLAKYHLMSKISTNVTKCEQNAIEILALMYH